MAPPLDAHPLEIIPTENPVYNDLYRLASEGLVPLWATSARPLTRREVAQLIAWSLDRLAVDRSIAAPAEMIRLERLVLEFSDELALLGYRVVEPPQGPSAQAITGWGVQVNRALVWRVESGVPPILDGSRIPDPGSRNWASDTGSWLRLEFTGTYGLGPMFAIGTVVRQPLAPEPTPPIVDRLYLTVGGQDALAEVGTMTHWWGPGWRGAFLLSDNTGPLETLRVSTASDRLRLVKLLAPLSVADERYLYAMRADWLVTDTVRLGVGESVVASGGVYLPYALNPLPLATYGLGLWIRQQQMGLTDNYNIALDFDWRLGRGTILYGEAYADDLATGGSPFPTVGGATAGLFFENPLHDGRTTLRLEHSQATNWIYTTTDGVNNYVRNGKALGQWCAPDCELWSAELSTDAGAGATLRLGYDLVRKGEGQLGQIWSSPADAWANLYLSGVVETTQAWRLRYAWAAGPDSRHEIGVTWSSAINAGHVAGQTQEDWLFWWEARYAF